MHDVCQHEIGGGLQMQSSFWSKPQLSRTHSRGVAYSQMAPYCTKNPILRQAEHCVQQNLHSSALDFLQFNLISFIVIWHIVHTYYIVHVETVAGYIIRRYWHGCCTKNRSSEGHIYFQCILCILHQKSLKRGHYRCSAYYTTQSCSFLLEFTTGNVVTLALLLTRPRCVRFITLTFDGKDLHIHPDNPKFLVVVVFQNIGSTFS